MKVLFDLNVLVDIARRWKKFPESLELYHRVLQNPSHEGGFPACGYTTLYYVLSQEISESTARAFLKRFQQTLRLLPFGEKTASSAQLLPLTDLEDACVAATAAEAGYDVIATRNVRHFAASPVPAKLPKELLLLLPS